MPLRVYFMFDRSLPAKLSRGAWKTLNPYLLRFSGDLFQIFTQAHRNMHGIM